MLISAPRIGSIKYREELGRYNRRVGEVFFSSHETPPEVKGQEGNDTKIFWEGKIFLGRGVPKL